MSLSLSMTWGSAESFLLLQMRETAVWLIPVASTPRLAV